MEMIDESGVRDFQTAVWDYYHTHGRHDLPWRVGELDPYHVLVSELMLQQTQVARVIPKYHEFLDQFPAVESLAAAQLGDVLRAWSGLGYNRRAKFLHQAAQIIMQKFGGKFPEDIAELTSLPGVGTNTAGAIKAYAFNQPVAFIETNIRTVYFHHFFLDRTEIPDKQVLELVGQTLDTVHPREWYWALMDYGAYLKRTVGALNHQSKTYTKQSKFEGSRRQVRGRILRALGEEPKTNTALAKLIPDERLESVLSELLAEGLVQRRGRSLSL